MNTLNQLNDLLFLFLEAVGVALISTAIYYGKQWITTHIKGLQQSNVNQILDQIDSLVQGAVAQTQNQIVDPLKQVSQFTDAKQIDALNSTVKTVSQELSTDAKAQLYAAEMDVDLIVRAKIEQYVRELKQNKK